MLPDKLDPAKAHLLDSGWWEDARCKVEGRPYWWDDWMDDHPAVEHPQLRAMRHARARNVCARCPVIEQCALDVDLARDTGIRAGELVEDVRRERGLARERHRHAQRRAGAA